MAEPPRGTAAGHAADLRFLRRVLIAGAIVVLALAAWQMRGALLLVFAGVVVATLLGAIAAPLEARLGLGRRWSLPAAVLLLAAGLGLAGALIGNELAAQAAQLAGRLPEAAETLDGRFGLDLRRLAQPSGEAAEGMGGRAGLDLAQQVASAIAGIGAAAIGAGTSLVVAIVGGIFLAADPARYRRGLVLLLPEPARERAEAALRDAGRALDLWLRAQLICMAMVGLLVGLGAWAIGLPSPLALGLFAGVADFVPFVGPLVGAAPGLLLAAGQGGGAVLWTLALYVLVQQVESSVLFPLLGQRMVSAPAALLIFAVVGAGALFGTAGILLAAPLTIVALVLVQRLYLRETLGEKVEVAGKG